MDELIVPAFMEVVPAEGEKIRICGEFVYTADCLNCGTKHFHGYNRCRSRWCLNCNYTRSLIWIAKLIPVMERWVADGKYISMLNFTIKDTEKLFDGLNILERSFRNIYNSTAKKRIRWKDRFPGGVRSLEVKKGKNSKLWHPHYHCLVLQDYKQKDFYWLRDEWKSAVQNYSMDEGSVWIKEVKQNGAYSLLKAVVEVLKYILKPDDTLYQVDKLTGQYDALTEAYWTLKGKRQTNTWGLLRGLNKEVDKELEKDIDEKKLADFICQRCGCDEYELQTSIYSVVRDENVFDLL